MQDRILVQLEAEVADLRGRLFALNVALAICVLLFMGLVWWTSPKPGIGPLTTTELVLVDDEGDVRGRLAIDPLGDASLRLYDSQGVSRVSLRADDEHGTLEMVDEGEHTRVRLSAVSTGSTLHLALGTHTAQVQAGNEVSGMVAVDLERSLMGEIRAGEGGAQMGVSRVPDEEPPQGAALVLGEAPESLGPELALVNGSWAIGASLHPKDGEPQMFMVGQDGGSQWTATAAEIRPLGTSP